MSVISSIYPFIGTYDRITLIGCRNELRKRLLVFCKDLCLDQIILFFSSDGFNKEMPKLQTKFQKPSLAMS